MVMIMIPSVGDNPVRPSPFLELQAFEMTLARWRSRARDPSDMNPQVRIPRSLGKVLSRGPAQWTRDLLYMIPGFLGSHPVLGNPGLKLIMDLSSGISLCDR
jgi:hypothetical protein